MAEINHGMNIRTQIEGKTFTFWTVLNFSKTSSSGNAFWRCRCKCGVEKDIAGTRLVNGKAKRCRKCNAAHTGMQRSRTGEKLASNHELYSTYLTMIDRCENKSRREYKNYGGRGITVCQEWRGSFARFLSDMGERPKGFTIERIDNDKGYEPSNCIWASKQDQMGNVRTNKLLTHNGETLHQAGWDRKMGFRSGTILKRLKMGWPLDRAIETPVMKRYCHFSSTPQPKS